MCAGLEVTCASQFRPIKVRLTLPRRTIHISRIACAHPHVGTTECRVPVRMRLFEIVCSLGGASSTWLISHVSCLFACTFSATGPINAYYTAWTGCEQPIARSPRSHVGWTHAAAAAAVLRTYIAACAGSCSLPGALGQAATSAGTCRHRHA